MMYLHEKLEEYGKRGRYPMHMPGHKRQLGEAVYAGDITEIDGFDNLHHSEDILKSDREKAALFYGAGEARFLVNGSTCGVLAAISAVTEYGDSIMIGRNSHKSAWHAIQLRGLRAEYVYPDASLYGEWSVDGPIPPDEVRRLLDMSERACEGQKPGGKPGPKRLISEAERHYACEEQMTGSKPEQRIRAVFITSPTYEGVISDVREIAAVCHEYGVPLIVDEAHGAHLKVMEVYGTGEKCSGQKTGARQKKVAGGENENGNRKPAVDHGEPVVEDQILSGKVFAMEDQASGGEFFAVENQASGGEFFAVEDQISGGGVSALKAGADIVILGLHKTMPVLTQAALLAVSRDAIREGRVSMKSLDEYLGIYESSSPSYVLMGSISRCIHWLDGSYEIEGQKVWERAAAYQKLLEETRRRLSFMRHFRLFPVCEHDEREIDINSSFPQYMKINGHEIVYDPGKIVISTKKTGLTGQELAEQLREKYGIEVEMASADYIIAMTSMFDTEEGMRGFTDAVLALDAALDAATSSETEEDIAVPDVGSDADRSKDLAVPDVKSEKDRSADPAVCDAFGKNMNETPEKFPQTKAVMSIAEAVAYAKNNPQKVKEKDISLFMETAAPEETEMSTEFIYVYPPGIPIAAPGEIITKGVAKKIICDYNSGCALIGCIQEEGKLKVRCVGIGKI